MDIYAGTKWAIWSLFITLSIPFGSRHKQNISPVWKIRNKRVEKNFGKNQSTNCSKAKEKSLKFPAMILHFSYVWLEPKKWTSNLCKADTNSFWHLTIRNFSSVIHRLIKAIIEWKDMENLINHSISLMLQELSDTLSVTAKASVTSLNNINWTHWRRLCCGNFDLVLNLPQPNQLTYSRVSFFSYWFVLHQIEIKFIANCLNKQKRE